MRRFYLIRNPLKDGTEELAQAIRGFLQDHGCVCSIHTDGKSISGDEECVITLGGDGTLLKAARELSGKRIPLIGVNMGTLGYLTQVGEKKDVEAMLLDLMENQFRLESRMMLYGRIIRGDQVLLEDQALNEIVIARTGGLRTLKFQVSVNGEKLCRYKADGMIIATPTGSTAYNLSAGGPVVEPTASMTILTPICPHELSGRSIVLSAEDQIEIQVLGHEELGQAAVFDGDTEAALSVGDRILVERSHMETVFVKLRSLSFVDHLRRKLAGI